MVDYGWAVAFAFPAAFGLAFYAVSKWSNRPRITKREAVNAGLCVFVPLLLLSVWTNYNHENPGSDGLYGYGPPDN